MTVKYGDTNNLHDEPNRWLQRGHTPYHRKLKLTYVMYHRVSFALEFCLAVVRPPDGSLASNLSTRCRNCAVSMHGSPILSFRPSETISYPFTCYEHVIAKAMGVMPMAWVDYWLPADSGDPGHLANPTPSGAATALLLRMQAGLGQT